MVTIKTREELQIMHEANQMVGTILAELKDLIRPGVTTIELDTYAEERISRKGAVPAFKGFRDYPNTLCTSINSGIVHGIPSKRQLKEGDILSLDLGVIYKGFYGDAAITYAVGKISPSVQRLLDVTRSALYMAIDQARVGNRVWDISKAVQQHVEKNGFSVVRDLVGHGIGKSLHEDPKIPNYVNSREERSQTLELREGMTLSIEPMVNQKDWQIRLLDDNWTTVTKDGGLSAHFEHTIAVSNNGPWILSEVADNNSIGVFDNMQTRSV